MILDCRVLLSQEWIILPHHIFHEANDVVNEHVKRGREHQCSFREYNKYPNFVYVKYVCDILKIGASRECPWTIFVTMLLS